MPLTLLVGHQELRSRLSQAITRDRLPQVLLVTGPSGVGKQRLALWLAQRLVCETAQDEPCAKCGSCLKVLNLAHPDVHWIVPVARPKAQDADKQLDEVAEALEGVMAARRATGLWGPLEGLASHGIATARLLQRQASLTAAEGGWRVFIVGRAERLVPQESSPDAANALLKLLEEPPKKSVFVLTTGEPGMVLPTIRSRAVPVRMSRVTDADVAAFTAATGWEIDVARAAGSIGSALAATDDRVRKAAATATAVLKAVSEGSAARTGMAMRQGVAQARGEFTGVLDAMAAELANRGRAAATDQSALSHRLTLRAVSGVERVLEAREQAQGNANPQLVLAALMDDLAALEGAT